MAQSDTVRPICYMVMPFRTKRVEEPRPDGAPAEIDFDRLWELAYRPAIEAMGYLAMRADADPNMVIIQAMLERIAFADLVLADVTLGNGNCYYEVGVRHVAQETRCVLVAPTWTRPLFDIAQFASVRFTLTDGTVTETEAAAIRTLLAQAVPKVADSKTPYHALVGPARDDRGRRSSFQEFAILLSTFQAQLRAIRVEPNAERRQSQLRTLIAALSPATLGMTEVAVELVITIRDTLGWKETVTFVDEKLPPATRRLPFVIEQRALAVAKDGSPATAIAELEQLITTHGRTPERLGLIGGRYKEMWRTARAERESAGLSTASVSERQALTGAIAHYEEGMQLDLNEYFCAANVALLLMERGQPGDAAKAASVEHAIIAACKRARALGTGDEYLEATLLGAAFRAGDVQEAEELTRQIEEEGPAAWKLETALKDLRVAVSRIRDAATQSQLNLLINRLDTVQKG